MSTAPRPIQELVQLHPDLWQASGQADRGQAAVPSGHPALDAQLPGGGWPSGSLTELLVRALGVGELRLLAPALRRLAHSGRQILLLAPPQLPYGPALAALGPPTGSGPSSRASSPTASVPSWPGSTSPPALSTSVGFSWRPATPKDPSFSFGPWQCRPRPLQPPCGLPCCHASTQG